MQVTFKVIQKMAPDGSDRFIVTYDSPTQPTQEVSTGKPITSLEEAKFVIEETKVWLKRRLFAKLVHAEVMNLNDDEEKLAL